MIYKFIGALFRKENVVFWIFIFGCIFSIGSYLTGNVRPWDPDTLTISDDFGFYGAIALTLASFYFVVRNAVDSIKGKKMGRK